MRSDTVSLAPGIDGGFGGSSNRLVVAVLNAASAAARGSFGRRAMGRSRVVCPLTILAGFAAFASAIVTALDRSRGRHAAAPWRARSPPQQPSGTILPKVLRPHDSFAEQAIAPRRRHHRISTSC